MLSRLLHRWPCFALRASGCSNAASCERADGSSGAEEYTISCFFEYDVNDECIWHVSFSTIMGTGYLFTCIMG